MEDKPTRILSTVLAGLVFCGRSAEGQTSGTNSPPGTNNLAGTNAPSKFHSPEDGWFDVSGFLDEKYGFLPVVLPITEPAVGYGAAGMIAFISKPLGETRAGFGRPNISMVGGWATENGTTGLMVGDVRHWMDDRLQTIVNVVSASVNLDFFGVGENGGLSKNPLRYNLEPRGGSLQGKYRIGDTPAWGGLSYAYASTRVTFTAPAGTPGLPNFSRHTDVGGLTPLVSWDSRDNIFTPTRGTFAEFSAGLFSEALGGDDEFQRLRFTALHYLPLAQKLFLGLRGEAAASYGNTPFYLKPYISLRGAPAMRYQGDEMALAEAELRWQCWKRFSLVGFVGGGGAWNNSERFNGTQTVVTGGTGIRYEIARKYGIHMGLDVAFGPDGPAIYLQAGSAWARP